MTYELDHKTYELSFNIGRLELIEKVTKKSIMAVFAKDDGLLGISDILMYLAYGLKECKADAYLAPAEAKEVAEKFLSEKGYAESANAVYEALQRDCGFLFLVS